MCSLYRNGLVYGGGPACAGDRAVVPSGHAALTPDSIWLYMMNRSPADTCPEAMGDSAIRTWRKLNGLPADGRDRRPAWKRAGFSSEIAHRQYLDEQARAAAPERHPATDPAYPLPKLGSVSDDLDGR